MKPSTDLLLKTGTTYIHCAVPPTNALNKFQKIIQPVQKLLGLSNWQTTHVFLSMDNRIIDRTGAYTVLSEQDAFEYLKTKYPGYTIYSYGTADKNVCSNFKNLFKLINTKSISFYENEFGEYLEQETNPNNSIYGLGWETAQTFWDAMSGLIKGTKLDEKAAITQAAAAYNGKPIPLSTQLQNPTYCSCVVGSLYQPLSGLPVLRYPALTHSFLDQYYQQFDMDFITTTVPEN